MKHYLLAFSVFIATNVTAQFPTDFRSEKIALNLWKSTVLPGDTMEIEGQVVCMTHDRFLPYSNYLYVECVNEADSVLYRQKISCKDKGYFSTRLPIDYEWAAGVYYIRAYTRLMTNFPPSGFPMQPFLVGKKFPYQEEYVQALDCRIVVAGGSLQNNCLQRLVLCLTDQDGFPVSMPLHLMNEDGNTISTVYTSRSGLAMLHFIPQPSCHYTLTSQDGKHKFSLPKATDKGLQIQGDLKGNRISYQIQGEMNMPDNFHLSTYDRLNGLAEYEVNKTTGIILLDGQPEVASLFLRDNKGNIISECTLYSPRSSDNSFVKFSNILHVGDTLHYILPETNARQRVLIRVIADNEPCTIPMEGSLRYLADYHSEFPFPVEVFSVSESERQKDLYAWLSSARFKCFDLMETAQAGNTIYRRFPEENMTFGGVITRTNNGRPLSEGTIVAYHTDKNFVYDASVNENGRFYMAVDDFTEGESFFLQAQSIKGKLDFYSYKIDSDTFPAVHNINRYRLPERQYSTTTEFNGEIKELPGIDGERHFRIPDVEIKARLKTETHKPTNQFYNTSYVDREEIENRDFQSLYEILQSMPGINIKKTTKEGALSYEIASNRGASTLGESRLSILLDNTRIDDLNTIIEMPVFDIESIELLRAWQTNAYLPGAIDGCIYIKTRQAGKKTNVKSKGIYYTPMGLSPLSLKPLESNPWIATQPGNYRLILDVITDENIRSYVCPFEVTSSKDIR